MLSNKLKFKKVVIITGRSDLRKGIDGFANMLQYNFNIDPFEEDVLFMFCGRSSSKIKGLLWDGDGFVLLSKRLESGRYQWPRTESEAKDITEEQFKLLIHGFNIISTIKPIEKKLSI